MLLLSEANVNEVHKNAHVPLCALLTLGVFFPLVFVHIGSGYYLILLVLKK